MSSLLGRLTHAQRLAVAATALFLLLAGTYSFSIGLRATRAAAITGDEPFYLLTAQSLLDDGDLDLRQQYERESYREFFDHPDGLWRQSVANERGEVLSPHEPGLSVLVAPGFAAGGLRGAQWELLLIAAAAFALAFVFTALETGSVLLSWLASVAVGLTATVFVYATEVYPEAPAGLCLVLALLLARREKSGAVAGICLALVLTLLVWLGIKYALLGSIVGVYFLSGASPRGRATFVALSSVSAIIYVWSHYALFGDLTAYSLNTVYEGAPADQVLGAHLGFGDRVYRLWGLFLDQRFGVGRWAPLLLLVSPSLALLVGRGRAGSLVFVLIVSQLLIASFVAITMMGWWFPGRTLVVVLPLVPLVLVLLWRRLPRPARAVPVILAACSAVFTGLLVKAGSAGEVFIAVDPFEMHAAAFAWSRWLFPDYRAWTFETSALTAVWLCAAVALGAYLLRPQFLALRAVLHRAKRRAHSAEGRGHRAGGIGQEA